MKAIPKKKLNAKYWKTTNSEDMGDIQKLLKAIPTHKVSDENAQLEAEYDDIFGDESEEQDDSLLSSYVTKKPLQPWEAGYSFSGQEPPQELTDPITQGIKDFNQSESESRRQIAEEAKRQIRQKRDEVSDKGQYDSFSLNPLSWFGLTTPTPDVSEDKSMQPYNQGQTTAYQYAQAGKNLTQAEKILSAPQKKDTNSLSKALSALGKGLVDVDTQSILSAGWSDVSHSLLFKRIADKLDQGQEPTDSEIALLESELIKNTARQTSDPSLLYSASKSISENIPFILQMMYTGGVSGTVQKGTQKVLTRLGERYGMKMAEKGAKKVFQQIGKKALTNIPATAAAIPLTSMFSQGVADNLAGNITQDENGNYAFVNQKNVIPALLKSFNDTFAEFYFESSGQWAKEAMKTLPIRKVFKNLPKGFMTDAYRTVAQASKYNGPIYELLEEELNGLYSGLTTGDQSVKDFFSSENQKQVAASVLAMSFGFGMLETPGKVMDWNDYRSKERAFHSIGNKDVINQIEGALSKESYSEQVEGLKNIDYSGLTDRERQGVTRYVIVRQKRDLYTGWKEDETQEESSPLRHDITGDIHPVLVSHEEDEDTPPTPAFLVGDSDEGLSFVYNPQTQKVEPVDPHQIEHQDVIPYEDWIKANTDLSVRQEEESALSRQFPAVSEGQAVTYQNKPYVVTNLTGDEAYLEETDTDGNILENEQSVRVPVSDLQAQMATPSPDEESPLPTVTDKETPGATTISPSPQQGNTGEQPADTVQTPGPAPVPTGQLHDIKLKGGISKAIPQPDGTFKIDKPFDTEKEAQREIQYLNEKFGKRGFTFSTEETLQDANNPFSDSWFNIKIQPQAKEVRNHPGQPGKENVPQGSRNAGSQNVQQRAQTRPESPHTGTEVTPGTVPPRKDEVKQPGPPVAPGKASREENLPQREIPPKPMPQEPGFNTWVAEYSHDPQELYTTWLDEKDKAPYYALFPWQQDVLTMRVDRPQFDDIVGKQGEGVLSYWFGSKPEEKLDKVAQHLSSVHHTQVTPQMVADFILSVPGKSVRKTTNDQLVIEKRFRQVTGDNIQAFHKNVNTQTPNQELEQFLQENNLGDSWFTPDDLIILLDENRGKLTHEQYDRFIAVVRTTQENARAVEQWLNEEVSPEDDFSPPVQPEENHPGAIDGTDPQDAGITPALTNTQQAELDKKLAEIDDQLGVKNETLGRLKKERHNKLAEVQNRNGLFGDTKATAGDLFADTFTFNRDTVINSVSGIDTKIDQANKEISRLETLRQGTIDHAGRQQELSIDEKKADVPEEGTATVIPPAESPQVVPESSKSQGKTYGQDNKLVSQARYEELKARLKGKLGNLNMGFDVEILTIGIEMAAYHIEAGARSFIDFSRRMIEDLGVNVIPYLKSFYLGAKNMPGLDKTGMDTSTDVENIDEQTLYNEVNDKKDENTPPLNDKDHVHTRPGDSKRNSQDTEAPIQTNPGVIQRERGRSRPEGDGFTQGGGNPDWLQRGKGIDPGTAPFTGEGSDTEVLLQAPGNPLSDTGDIDGRGRGIDSPTGDHGYDPDGDEAIGEAVERVSGEFAQGLISKRELQRQAEDNSVETADIDNIRDTLPYLLAEQQDDVLKAEHRFFSQEHQEDTARGKGKGFLFTNGTGTGKTYTGLGIIKRFVKQGKDAILIVVPSQQKVNDWVKDAKNLFLAVSPLENTSTAGEGQVVTTYANFRDNEEILKREWDLIVYDESHRLMEGKRGEASATTHTHYAASNRDEVTPLHKLKDIHPLWKEERQLIQERWQLNKLKNQDLDATPALTDERLADIEKRLEKISQEQSPLLPAMEVKAKELTDKTKVVFLSATPFKGHFNLRYAHKYLFDWGDQTTYEGDSRVDAESRFFLDHFGAAYEWKYHRLQTNSKANAESVALQERQFAEKLIADGVMSGRMIDSDKDYSREFPKVAGFNSELFNRAFSDIFNYQKEEFGHLRHEVAELFYNYQYSTQLFEVLKTSMVLDRIQQHLDMGRKVVVYHRRHQANVSAPFATALQQARTNANKVLANEDATKGQKEEATAKLSEIRLFKSRYADLLRYEQTLDYSSVIRQFAGRFGDRVGFFNGQVPQKERASNVAAFNTDHSGKDILVIQEESGKEGISLHDTTGTHQRVLINLALPVSSTTTLQIEGRTYRIGNQSNAIFEYPLLGIDIEIQHFGHNLNKKLSTTENLAMGEQARDLIRSFAEGVLFYSSIDPPNEGQGTGGKEYDRAAREALTQFDKAIAYYFTNVKRRGRNKSAEGIDYYPTPEPLGQKMVEWLNVREGQNVLEPSAGHGAIAMWVPQSNNLTAIEPSFELAAKLSARAGGGNKKIINSNFEDFHIVNKFDGVVMNPPFGSGGKTAIEHLEKAFDHLREGGRLVAIVPNGPSMDKRLNKFLYGEDDKGKLLYPDAVLRKTITLPSITFDRAGTSVRTKIVIIDKLEPEDQKHLRGSYTVEIPEVKTIEELFDHIRDMDAPQRFNNPDEGIRQSIIGEKGAQKLVEAGLAVDAIKNLTIAKEMEAAGKNTKTIWLATGWERGVDQKWKYEISDDYLSLNLDRNLGKRIIEVYGQKFEEPNHIKLSDIISAKKLFEAYPQFKDYTVSRSHGKSSGSYGAGWLSLDESYFEKHHPVEIQKELDSIRKKLVEISNNDIFEKESQEYEEILKKEGNDAADEYLSKIELLPHNIEYSTLSNRKMELQESKYDGWSISKTAKGTIIHEIQHAIQEQEGFAQGGDTDFPILPRLSKEEEVILQTAIDDGALSEKSKYDQFIKENQFLKKTGSFHTIKDAIDKGEKYVKTLLYYNNKTRYEQYKALAGEVEARNADKRHFLTPEERAAKSLSETEDVSRESQIVLMDQLDSSGRIENTLPENIEERQQALQDYYNAIGRGAEMIIYNDRWDIVDHYKKTGGLSKVVENKLASLSENNHAVFVPSNQTIYANVWKIGSIENADRGWIHENGIHFGAYSLLPRDIHYELFVRIFSSVGEDKIREIIPSTYWSDTALEKGEEYCAFLAEKLFDDGKIDINNYFTVDEIEDITSEDYISEDEIIKLINTFVRTAYNQKTLKYGTEQQSGNKILESRRGREGRTFDESYSVAFGRRIGALPETTPGRKEQPGSLRGSSEEVQHRNDVEKPIRYVGTLFNAIYTKPQSDVDVREEELPETIEVDGITRPTTNSNGEPIYSTEDGVRNFWQWFGNSQVIDNQGRPQVVYHGTENSFTIFQHKRIVESAPRNMAGYYFSDKDFAQTYGDHLMPAYLKIEHPKEHDKIFEINKKTDWYTRQGYDGIITKEKKHPVWVIFNSNQAKSATGNIGQFAPNNPDIRFRNIPPRQTPGGNKYVGDIFENNPKPFTPFVKTWADRQIENFQDKMLSVKRLLDEVQKRGGTITDEVNPYQEENLSAGRVKTFMDDYDKNTFQPLLGIVAELTGEKKSTLEEVQNYLMAKHAPERNAYLREQKEEDSDNNDYSGIVSIKTSFSKKGMNPDEIAARIVGEFEQKYTPAQIDKLWKAIKENTNYTLAGWLKYGFIDKGAYESLKGRYDNYVPLRGWEPTEEDQLHNYISENTGKGFNLIKKAEGRTSQAEGPLQYIANMAHTAIVAGERNLVKQAAYRLAKAHPNMKDLFAMKKVYLVNTGQTDPETGKEIWQEQTKRPTQEQFEAGLVKVKVNTRHMMRKPLNQAQEHEVLAIVNGEKFIIVFKDENVGRAINNNNLSDMALHIQLAFQQSIGNFTRWLSANFTARNPAFIPVNTMRDMSYAFTSHLVKGGFTDAWHFASTAGIFAPIPFIGRIGSLAKQAIIRNLNGKFDPNNKYDVWYKEFKENGGETGYIHLKDVDYFKRQIEREIKRANKDNSYWDKMAQARVLQWSGEVLEHYAVRSENLSRFATYVVSREKGKTAKEAAYAAKEITVNFNRKGKYTGVLGSMYAFFNASVQGGANVIGLARNNPKALTAVSLGFMSLGVLSALLNSLWADDDDDYTATSDYIKQNFLVLPGIEPGQFITIPLPHGFRAFYGLGVQGVQYAMGKKKPVEIIQQAASNFFSSVSPIDITSIAFPKAATPLEVLRPVTPTMAIPFVDIASNLDFAGRKIYKEPFTQALENKLADVSLSLQSVNPYLQKGFESLYQLGGGDISIKTKLVMDDDGNIQPINELFDWNPSKAEHILEYYLGGRGTFFNDIIKVATEIAQSAHRLIRNDKSFSQALTDFDFNKVPVWKRLYRKTYKREPEEIYWQTKDEVSNFNYLENKLLESGQVNKVLKLYDNKAFVSKMTTFKAYDHQVQKINDLLKDTNNPGEIMQLISEQKQLIRQCIHAIR
jgi:predicted RNA methylase